MRINKQKVFNSMKDAKATTKVMTKTYTWTVLTLLGLAVLVFGAFAGFTAFTNIFYTGDVFWAVENIAMWIFVSGAFASLMTIIAGFNPVSMLMLKLAKKKVAKKARKTLDKAQRENNASARSLAKTATK